MFSRALAAMAWGLAVWTAAAAAPLAQEAPSFPAALDAESLSAWLKAQTSLPAASIVSVGASSVIGLKSATPVAGSPNVHRAVIWAEVVSPQTASAGGYLSWSAEVDVDCRRRQSKAGKVINFPRRNLQGAPKPASGAADWVSPSVGTQLYSLIAAVCDPSFRRPFATLAAAPPTPVASVVSKPSPEPKPAPSPPAVAAAKPETAPPAKTVADAPKAPAPRPPAPKPAAGKSRAAVQLSASDSEAQARQALAAARRRFPAELSGFSTTVAPAGASGRTVYRALVHGFAGRADAARLCELFQARGQACFVRNDFAGR